MTEIFTAIYRHRGWWDGESISGTGSSIRETAALRAELPGLLKRLEVRSLLDIPCGDGLWMSSTELSVESYIGADIVGDLVRVNERRLHLFPDDSHRYRQLDLTRDELPRVDLILCRDGLVHLSDTDVFCALSRMRRSGSRYLLATTFPARSRNRRIVTGDWRPLNLEVPPFRLGPPRLLLQEQPSSPEGGYGDKSLGLWRIEDLPDIDESVLFARSRA